MKIRYGLRTACIFLMIILLASTSFLAVANQENAKDKSSDMNDIQKEPLGKLFSVMRGWAVGNATSGKLVGLHHRIAKINFEFLAITKLKFFPPRWETANFYNNTAYLFNLNQTIPQGPFELQKDWVIAVVIKI